MEWVTSQTVTLSPAVLPPQPAGSRAMRAAQAAALRKIYKRIGQRLPQGDAVCLCQWVVWRSHDDERRPGKGNVFKHRVVAGVADESHVEPFLGHGLQQIGGEAALGVQLKAGMFVAGCGKKFLHQVRHSLGRQLADAAQQHQPAAAAHLL